MLCATADCEWFGDEQSEEWLDGFEDGAAIIDSPVCNRDFHFSVDRIFTRYRDPICWLKKKHKAATRWIPLDADEAAACRRKGHQVSRPDLLCRFMQA